MPPLAGLPRFHPEAHVTGEGWRARWEGTVGSLVVGNERSKAQNALEARGSVLGLH